MLISEKLTSLIPYYIIISIILNNKTTSIILNNNMTSIIPYNNITSTCKVSNWN